MVVRVVCDNHDDRLAVLSYFVVNVRAVGLRLTAPNIPIEDGRHVDLCAECAQAIEGPPGETVVAGEDEPISEAQRRLLFARCHEIGIGEDGRHALLARATGDPSSRNLLAKDFDRVMTALDREQAAARA